MHRAGQFREWEMAKILEILKKKLQLIKGNVLFLIIGLYCLPSGFPRCLKARIIVIFLYRWIIADVYADLFHLNYPNIF